MEESLQLFEAGQSSHPEAESSFQPEAETSPQPDITIGDLSEIIQILDRQLEGQKAEANRLRADHYSHLGDHMRLEARVVDIEKKMAALEDELKSLKNRNT